MSEYVLFTDSDLQVRMNLSGERWAARAMGPVVVAKAAGESPGQGQSPGQLGLHAC